MLTCKTPTLNKIQNIILVSVFERAILSNEVDTTSNDDVRKIIHYVLSTRLNGNVLSNEIIVKLSEELLDLFKLAVINTKTNLENI